MNFSLYHINASKEGERQPAASIALTRFKGKFVCLLILIEPDINFTDTISDNIIIGIYLIAFIEVFKCLN